MDIGFVGLGNMGSGMASNLLKAGHAVTVYNRSKDKVDALTAQGARPARTVAEACGGEAVVSMLANDDAVEAVSFGADGIIANLADGAVHVSSSTISVALAECLTAAHSGAGQSFVTAPVFGRPEAAAAAKLFVVVAGASAAVQGVSPIFDAIGQRTFVVSDDPTAASLIKLSGNFLIASVIESLGEAMALVGKAGVDKQQCTGVPDLRRSDRARGVRTRRIRRAARLEGRPTGAGRGRGTTGATARREPPARPLPDTARQRR
jgi:3-hydroxyisobutyrate dehydrogenase-like beta-hydroxyacid dehydrogenase